MNWKLAEKIPAAAREKLQVYSDISAQLLHNRGIDDEQTAESFFANADKSLHDPYLLPGIKKAAAEIIGAVKNRKKIVIYGDYDVDGISASAILFDFLYRELHADVLPYIPNRFAEGYGLSSIGLEAILKQKTNLVVTVDCGIRDADLIAEFSGKGLQFIVTDHHALMTAKKGKFVLPDRALAVVHPGLPESKYPFTGICATTVAWKLVSVLAELAQDKGLLKKKTDTEKYLDLVALATVCDCMDLVDENRYLVKKGLEILKNSSNAGLAELLYISQVNPADLDTYHLGFVLGPRLNAAGRVEDALQGLKLLTSRDKSLISMLAEKLNKLNIDRQELTKKMLDQAEQQILNNNALERKLLFVSGEDWSEGVVGLVAGKITERYQRPTLAASINGSVVKGSARSIAGFNITEAIAAVADKLERFGGHAAAAGFTLKKENLREFIDRITAYAEEKIKLAMLEKELRVEAEVSEDYFSEEFSREIDLFKPFGMGNAEPNLLMRRVRAVNKQTLGKEQQHLKMVLKKGARIIDAIGFNLGARAQEITLGSEFDLVGQIMIKQWHGKNYLQFKLKDFQKSSIN